MKLYRNKLHQPMRPYEVGECMLGSSFSEADILEEGGMIAFNPMDEYDQWYVDKEFFETNYEEVGDEGTSSTVG